MRNHKNKIRDGKNVFSKVVNLETTLVDCIDCERKTAHVYLGNFGCVLTPKHSYQCMHCKTVYVSPKKVKLRIERFTRKLK